MKTRRITFTNSTMFTLIALCSFLSMIRAENILDGLDQHENLKTFTDLAKQDPLLKALMESKQCTVFAPTNDAYERFKQPADITAKTPFLHTIRILGTPELFPSKYHSELPEAADLFLSKIEADESNDVDAEKKTKYFVNNALIIDGPKKYTTNDGKSEQLLYIIDEVLYPYSAEQKAPNADQLFDSMSYTGLKTYDGVNVFLSKIRDLNLRFLFQRAGNNTFFIPLSVPSDVERYLDDAAIRGHVIHHQALFTRTVGEKVYHSTVYNDTFKVELSIDSQNVSDSLQTFTYRVQSNTLSTMTTSHHNGISKVKISRANVPVSNGVVHFIDMPLMIISNTIAKILEEKMYAFLSEITRMLQSDPQIKSMLENPRQITLLAFTDTAFQRVGEKWKAMSEDERKEILKLHIISGESIPSGSITETRNKWLSMAAPKEVFFNVYEGPGGKRVLSVEGGGVNATATQADIGATNGIIHVIDRVLGIPFQTIKEKLETDSNVRTTYDVGAFGPQNWSDQLGRTDQKFTLFAPSAKAWEYMSNVFPSEYKQLTEGLYPSNAHQILDRHLLIGEVLMAHDIQTEKVIKTVRGEIKIKRTPANELQVEWEDVYAPVSRSDVLSMNGVIHEIDRVLMKKRDLAVSPAVAVKTGGNAATTLFATTLPLLILTILQLV